MKDMLLKKRSDLQKSLDGLTQQQAQIAEQIVMYRGALQYNDMLLKEMEAEEAEAKAPLAAVE